MSNFRGTRLVAARELREATRRKSFWAVAAVLVAGSTAAVVVPDLIGDDGPTRWDVAVVEAPDGFADDLRASAEVLEARVELRDLPDAAAAQRAVEDGDVDIALVGGAQEPTIVVKKGEHATLVAATQQAVAAGTIRAQVEDAGLTPAQAEEALRPPPVGLQEVDAGEANRRAAAVVVSIVLYLVLLMLMIQVANGVAIEKSNRISEVLLPIVRPQALLFGKVLGVGVIGLVTLACAAVPVLVKAGAGGDLPEGLGTAVAGGAAWFVMGTALYLTLAGALGALVERQEEAGTVVTPLTLLLVVAYLVGQSAPDSPVGTVFAYLPLTSPLVMPPRIAVEGFQPAEAVVSLGLGVLAVLVVLRFGALVYRRAIVRTGRKLKLSEVLRAT